MVGDFMASEGSPLLLEDEVVTLADGVSRDFQFVEIDIAELPHSWEGGEYHHHLLYSSVLDIAEEELAAVSGGEGVLNPSSPSAADYYVMEELIDDSSSSSSYRSLFDVEVVDVSEYQLSPPGGGEHVYPLMSKELLSLRQQLLDDHFPSRAARYAPDSSSSSTASSYFRYSSDLGQTLFSGSSSSCLSMVSIVLLVVLVVCIVVFLPFGDPRGMAREWMRMRCDRAGAATDDEKSKRKTAALSMSLADAIFILGCAADQLQSMHCSWYDASTTDANTSSSSISLRTLHLLATTLERELSLGVGLEPHRMLKRTRRRSEFILSKLAVLLTKLNRDKDAMNRRLALHTCNSSSSNSSSGGEEEDMHLDDRIELFLRTNELSCVVEDLSAVRHRIVMLQAGSECRHLLAVVDCLKAAISARDVHLLVDAIENAAIYCQEDHTDGDGPSTDDHDTGDDDGDEREGEEDLCEQEAGSTMRTLRRHLHAASQLLDELYRAEEEQVREKGLLRRDELRDALKLLSGGLSLEEDSSSSSIIAAPTEVALPSNALSAADLQMMMPPGNSIVVSLWTIECIRTREELADRTEHQLQRLGEQRSQRRVAARNTARMLRADRDREIRGAQLSLAAIGEQKMTRAAAEEQSLRAGWAALSEESRRLRRAQRLADFRLFCGLAVLLPVVYLGCCLLMLGPETNHMWDMTTHPLERCWSFFMSFLSRLCDHLTCADSSSDSIDSSSSSSRMLTERRPGLRQTALLISPYTHGHGYWSMSNWLLLPALWNSSPSLLADGLVVEGLLGRVKPLLAGMTCGIKVFVRLLPSKTISFATKNLLGLRHAGFERLSWLVLFCSFADVFLLMAAGVLRSLLLVAVSHTLSLVLLRLTDGSRLRWRTSLGGGFWDIRPFVVYVLYPCLAVIATAGLASLHELQ